MCQSFKAIETLLYELSCTQTHTHIHTHTHTDRKTDRQTDGTDTQTDRHTDGHEYSIGAVDKPQLSQVHREATLSRILTAMTG